jgi:hypothetical protein
MLLKELRRLFRRGETETERRERLREEERLKAAIEGDFRYKIQKDGKDAMMMYGKYKFHTVSSIQKQDPEYLDAILNRPTMPQEIKEIIRYVRFGSFAGEPVEREITWGRLGGPEKK